ncbi:MAG: hypothetical protein ACRC2H_02170 [Silanimonas sp.]
MRALRSTRGLLVAVSAALALAGCPQATRSDTSTTDPASTSINADSAALAEATRPVEFNLGPNRFVLPANWFVDGIGPDFQGGVTLALHWPSLEPYPPGQPYSSFTTGPMRNHAITVLIDYIDRVPIDELPERFVTPQPGQDANDPSTNIPLRERLPDRHGLELYRPDLQRVALHQARIGQRPPKPPEFYLGANDDWFIGRDADGRIRTVVMCEDQRVPEGFEIRDETLVSIGGSTRWPLCDGRFSMAELSLSISASYHRPILRDWRRIEFAVREALRQAHDAANPTISTGAPRP